jgi:AcrR family transcriptional regulator
MPEKELGQIAAECCADSSEHDARARNRLLRAAVEVFDRKGYAAASVREIVEQAGLTKPALYYHFGSKEGVLVAILQESARELAAAVARGAAAEGDARTRLTRLSEEVYRLFQRNVPVIRVAHAVYFGPREAVPPFDFRALDRPLEDGIAQIVEDGFRAGEFNAVSAGDVAMALRGAIIGCLDQEAHGWGGVPGTDGLRRVLALVFEGVSAKSETARRSA